MSRLQRSSVNMIASALGYLVPMVVNFISTPLLLRQLGETAFGLQSLVAVVIGYLAVMDMGLEVPVVKLLAEDRAKGDIDSENRMLSTTLQLYAVIGILGMVAIMLLADWLARGLFKVSTQHLAQAVIVFRLAGIGFLGSTGLSWGRALAMGLQRFEISYGVSIALNIIGVSSGLAMVYIGYGVVGFVSARVLVSIASGPAYWLLARQLLPSFSLSWGVDLPTLHRVRGYIGYGAINRVVGSLVGRLDQTLIGVWLGVAAAGIYSIPFLVTNALGNLISYTLGFIFPLASELHSDGQTTRLREIFIVGTQFSAALSGMIFAPVFALGNNFLALWVPDIAARAAGVMRLLTLAAYFGALCTSLAHGVVIGTGRIRQFTIYATIRNVVLALGCYLMIRPFGLLGAGWAVLLTVVVDALYLRISLRYYIQLSPKTLFLRGYFKAITLSIALALSLWFVRFYINSWLALSAAVVLGDVMFILVALLVGIFGTTEFRALSILWHGAYSRFAAHKEADSDIALDAAPKE